MVAALERRPGPEPAFLDNPGPPGRAGFTVDPGEQLRFALDAQRARSGEVSGVQVAEQAVDGGSPEAGGAADSVSDALDPASHGGALAVSRPGAGQGVG